MMFTARREVTSERRASFRQYYSDHILRGEHFLCGDFTECCASHMEAFYEGQPYYVVSHFDTSLENKPFRVVLAGQEYGHGPALVEPNQRTEMLQNSALAPRGFHELNPLSKVPKCHHLLRNNQVVTHVRLMD